MRTTAWTSFLLFLLGVVGCGSGDDGVALYPVLGRVTFKNRPTPGALVVFAPQKAMNPDEVHPRGYVKEDGTFQLTTRSQNDGAPAGDYIVTISWRRQADEDEAAGRNQLPSRYARPQSSDLRATVAADNDNLPIFELTQ